MPAETSSKLYVTSFPYYYYYFFEYFFFGGLECVGHSFAYVAHLWFWRDVWIRTQSAAEAIGRATNLATHTDKKENQVFLIYKEIQSGADAKSYMRKRFLIYEEMRKYFPIYEEAVCHIWLCNCSTLNFLTYEENFILFFISASP